MQRDRTILLKPLRELNKNKKKQFAYLAAVTYFKRPLHVSTQRAIPPFRIAYYSFKLQNGMLQDLKIKKHHKWQLRPTCKKCRRILIAKAK